MPLKMEIFLNGTSLSRLVVLEILDYGTKKIATTPHKHTCS
jgi:hypothetical protein